jgi:N-acetylmuramoyl-L-alanine amidase
MSPTVVIDPGHGGSVAVGGSSANNAVGPHGLLEKDLTLDIGRRVAALLVNRATVLLTRSVDENRSLSDRAKIARDADADVFLSIHLNGWKESSVDGSEAWVAKRAGAASRALARSVLDRVLGVTHARDRGVQEQDFGVLLSERQGPHTAASLLEVAFLTNPDEAERFMRGDYKQALAIAIADGIASQLQTNGTAATAAALGTTAQQEAIDALNAFRAETTAGSFTPTRVDVADRAIALVNDPTLMEQGGLGLCGPAAVHRLWIKRDPKAFAAYITSLYDTGSGTFGDRTISAGADLRNQDYYGRAVPAMEALAKNPRDKAEFVCPSADWVAMSSLRDASNIFLDFEGMPDEDYAAGTSASEVAGWLRSTGAYASVSEEGNFFLTKGPAHAEGLHPGPDTDVVLLINAHILTADAIVKGKTKSDDFIGSAFPNHVVVLESDVTEPTPDEVEFTCFTWGGTMHIRLRKEIFEANYYGAIVAHVSAPTPASLALAAGAAPTPADLRVAQLVTDPYRPEAMAPFRFMVECANVGGEETGPFVVRFELDQAESVELSVQNVAPHESEWVSWPHDGMRAGDHHIYCLLDAAHAVPESEEQRNQQSVYFKVAEIEFPPQDADGDAHYDEKALANEVIHTIADRVDRWLILAVQAVVEWQIDAKKRVAAYNDDANVVVDPFPVITAFSEAIIKNVPGLSKGLGIIQDAYGLLVLVRENMGDQHMGLPGARARLIAAIDELTLATGKAIRQAIKDHDARLRARLSPDNDDSPLHQIDYGSTDPEYVAALADWLGVPVPDEENTTVPIKKEMMEGFERVMEDVDRQLWREGL